MNKVYSVKLKISHGKFVQRHKFADYEMISECIQDVSFVTLKGA